MSKKHFKTITSNYIQPEQYVDFLVFLRIQLKKKLLSRNVWELSSLTSKSMRV